jgi:hypothetical protein
MDKILQAASFINKFYSNSSTKNINESDKSNLNNSILSINEDENNNETEEIINTLEESVDFRNLDDWLLHFREINLFYTYTGIHPKYIFYLLIFIIGILIINYFSYYFTILIGIIYPFYCSVGQLIKKNKNKKEIKRWLEYWLVFFLFINIETIFGRFLEKIQMYLFYKFVFLSICFLPQYNGAHYIYYRFLSFIFKNYEKIIYKYSRKITENLKNQIMLNNLENDQKDK